VVPVISYLFFTEHYRFACVVPYCVFVHLLEPKKRALKFCEHLSNCHPVNSDLKPVRAFLDDVRTKTSPAEVEVCILDVIIISGSVVLFGGGDGPTVPERSLGWGVFIRKKHMGCIYIQKKTTI